MRYGKYLVFLLIVDYFLLLACGVYLTYLKNAIESKRKKNNNLPLPKLRFLVLYFKQNHSNCFD
jgi:hypothetical protein